MFRAAWPAPPARQAESGDFSFWGLLMPSAYFLVIACGVLKAKPKKSHGKNSHATNHPEARDSDGGKGHGHGTKPGHGQDD